MVDEPLPTSPERALAIAYAPRAARAGLAALLALDDRLAGLVRRAREPLVGQMRLTWWFEALERLDREPPPAEPVLRALAAEVIPRGVTGASLAAMIDGWEVLLGEGALDEADVELFARARGRTLFAAMATVCAAPDVQAGPAGEGWALADLANNLSDATEAARVRVAAATRLRAAFDRRWSRQGRALGALALLARFEIDGSTGPAARVARLMLHRMTGL